MEGKERYLNLRRKVYKVGTSGLEDEEEEGEGR